MDVESFLSQGRHEQKVLHSPEMVVSAVLFIEYTCWATHVFLGVSARAALGINWCHKTTNLWWPHGRLFGT